MAQKIHLWMEDIIEVDESLTIQTKIELPQKEKTDRIVLWYRLPCEYRSDITTQADPFIIGTIFMAMRESADLIVHGQVSPSLLRNLEEFQSAWALWLPERYTKIDIIADSEQDNPKVEEEHAIAAFSGGVDASFTLWRHKMNRCGRLRRDIEACVFIHGFDIPLLGINTYKIVHEGVSKMVESLDTKLIPVATNVVEILNKTGNHIADYHATTILSCMAMLKGRYNIGLIASTESYDELVLPWGSNPITDGLLSSNDFQIIHDGAAIPRHEKIAQLVNWPEAMKYLRVCRGAIHKEDVHQESNCCRCEKCIRTILGFRAMGISSPQCFKEEVSDEQILHLKLAEHDIHYMRQIHTMAKANAISGSWVKALEKCIVKNSRSPKARIIGKLKQIPAVRKFYNDFPTIRRLYNQWKWNRRSH